VATLSAGEPGVPGSGAERGPAPGPLTRALGSRFGQLALAAGLLLALAALALHFDATPRGAALDAVPDTVRAVVAAIVVFAIGGFGLVRLLLPAPLRPYEALWVLPTGACAVGLAMTILGFAALPYPASLALVMIGGVALGYYAVRRRGWPDFRAHRLAWPTFLALLVLAVAVVPMVFVLHYAAPVGTGSDAHLATGVAQFLQHSYPTSVNLSQPIQQMQPTWQSKYPIYYAFAAVSTISGLSTWQVLAPLAAVLLALAGTGLFLVARQLFGAALVVALVAMCVAVLDREALRTVLNPYFNQTWGFFALPFTLVLGWWAVQPGLSRRARLGAAALLALFALVLVLAYPLAAPIPAIPLLVFVFLGWRRRVAAGEPTLRLRDVYRGRKSLLWMVPVAALLAIPVAGAADKTVQAVQALAPGHAISGSWAGDLPGFLPWNYFFSLPNSVLGTVVFAGVLVLAAIGLARQPRALAWGLGGLIVLGLLMALYLRHRHRAYYFEFKLLAFVGPLVVLIAAIGAGRLRRAGPVLLAVLVGFLAVGVVGELHDTGYQLPQATIQLGSWSRSLPRNASVRLDMWPPLQLWAAYFLAPRPLCSQTPLVNTDYPHVAWSVKADYILAFRGLGRPKDAIGPPLRQNQGYLLFRQNPDVTGPSTCSQRLFDKIYTGPGYSPH
jgi:hypothetical protein